VYTPPALKNFGRVPISWSGLVELLFSGIIIALVGFTVGFYCLFHAWMNGMAELLRFADRQFYGAWWTSTNVFEYFRRWNMIVFDFIHFYAYRELRRAFSRPTNVFIIFFVSGCLHEVVISVAWRFVYPVCFCGYVLVLVYVCPFRKRAAANCFWWCIYTLLIGLMISLYLIEICARKNCALSNNFGMPVSWRCNGFK
jgi:sterol O-acyltransferase